MFKLFGKKTLTILFHMRGGHVIRVPNVKKITMKNDPQTGGFSAYQVTYQEGYEHPFLSLSIPDIVAVTEERK